nr:hypothetical protein [uncultured Methanobacterium sp.]
MAEGSKGWFVFNLLLIALLAIVIGNLAYKQMINFLTLLGVLLLILSVIGLLVFLIIKGKDLTSNAWASISSILIILLMTISGLFAPKGVNYIIIFFSLLLFFIVIGVFISGRLPGILIDERNQMSLSRFQIVVWTLILLSAYFTIALARIAANVDNPLAIGIEPQLWALLGISTVSLVGSPLLLSEKKKKQPTQDEADLFEKTVDQTKTTTVGIVPQNTSIESAEFADIFKGDETATLKNVNMAKVQMFFFTIIVAVSYGVMLYALIANNNPAQINSFPALDDSIIAILAISHAGYLTNKAIDQTAVDKTV